LITDRSYFVKRSENFRVNPFGPRIVMYHTITDCSSAVMCLLGTKETECT